MKRDRTARTDLLTVDELAAIHRETPRPAIDRANSNNANAVERALRSMLSRRRRGATPTLSPYEQLSLADIRRGGGR